MLRDLLSDRRGAIAVIFAVLAPVMVLCAIGVINVATLDSTKTHLQDATDAAALAVSAAVSANPNTTEPALKATATTLLQTDFQNGSQTVNTFTPSISSFSVCTPVAVADCLVVNGQPSVTNTVSMVTTVRAHCYASLVMPGLCNSAEQSVPMTVSNTTNIGFAANIQINMLLDVSGSMIVGSTQNDVQSVINWNNIPANWATVHDPNENSQPFQQTTPCAFACHDQGPSSSGVNGPTTSGSANSDMQLGLTNAHAAGATTRYDVMVQSAGQVIQQEQANIAGNSQLAKNSYYFNIYSIADSLTNVYKATVPNDWTDPVTSLNKLYVGLDTHLNENLPAFANTVGTNGTGATAATPLKFVVLITDGVESDFYSDFYSCGNYVPDAAWNVSPYQAYGSMSPGWPGYYETGCFTQPMSTAQCTAMKNNGVVLAVLETPYVPLTGQDTGQDNLYEFFVRHILFPNGPGSSSTVSAALQSCATTGYYYQANPSDSSSIAKGLANLINKFLASTAYLRQ